MEPVADVPMSQSMSEVQRSIEALTNILFVIRQTKYNSQDLELYLQLAEKELERLRLTVRLKFDGQHNN